MIKSDLELRLRDLKAELGSKTLVAVSKYSPVEDVALAYSINQIDFGENRVSELKTKAQYFEDHNLRDVRWHFIGTLQTNKVKDLLKIPHLWAIHSVSSHKVLEELLKRESEFQGESLKLFFQINTSHEDEKSGFEEMDDLYKSIELLLSQKNSKFIFYGLMTMAAIRTDDIKGAALKSFKDLRSIRDQLIKKYSLLELKLSMGMSGDYKEAIQEDSDFVRIGSLIFKS